MGVKHVGNSKNHENQSFGMFGKVKGGWPIATSVRNIWLGALPASPPPDTDDSPPR